MPELTFRTVGAKAVPHTAAPLLAIELEVTADPPGPVHAVVLQCQVRIEPQKRRYDAQAQADLKDLFGEPHRWGQTLKGMLWTHAGVVVPRFDGRTTVDLPVPCTFTHGGGDGVPRARRLRGAASARSADGFPRGMIAFVALIRGRRGAVRLRVGRT